MSDTEAVTAILKAAISARERQTFQSLGEWKQIRDIAVEMCISIKTVETNVCHLRLAFGCPDMLALRRVAVEYFTQNPQEIRVYERQVFKTYAPDSRSMLRQKLGIINKHRDQ